jgi:hypothetical protein
MPNPLNPMLYRQLTRVFGHVRISNEGEAMTAHYVKDVKGNDVLSITQTGEYYNVCCPRCNDTRFRLQVNHRWGKRDDLGRRNLWLAICHNENCFNTQEKREDLLYDLTEIDGVLEGAKIKPGIVVTEARDASPPGPVSLLHELPPSHPANRYLAGRFFDPERLGRFYGVGVCEQSHYWLARNRIYVPVFKKGLLKGWQVRYVGELDWKAKEAPPKWWTDPSMKKRLLLYNLDEARKYRTGVIVEGAGDVWGFGPMATATFGSNMSLWQRREFAATFRDGSAVLLYDPDLLKNERTRRSYQKLVDILKNKFRHGFAPVTLPAGTDPGSLDRGFLRAYVTQESKAQGVKVWWDYK